VTLPADGSDWALTPDRNLLLVSIPSRHAVAVIDTNQRRLEELIDVGADGTPGRILVERGGRRSAVPRSSDIPGRDQGRWNTT